MPLIKEWFSWPKSLRDRVKRSTKRLQLEELRHNLNLVKTGLRDVVLVAIDQGLTSVDSMDYQEFRKKLDEIKRRP